MTESLPRQPVLWTPGIEGYPQTDLLKRIIEIIQHHGGTVGRLSPTHCITAVMTSSMHARSCAEDLAEQTKVIAFVEFGNEETSND